MAYRRVEPWDEKDWQRLETLCSWHCTLGEIAAFFRCSEDTVERRIKEHMHCNLADMYAQNVLVGKMALRQAMWTKALNKQDNTMLIWLSKQHLGMSDKHEERVIQEKPSEVNFIWQSAQTPELNQQFYDGQRTIELDPEEEDPNAPITPLEE